MRSSVLGSGPLPCSSNPDAARVVPSLSVTTVGYHRPRVMGCTEVHCCLSGSGSKTRASRIPLNPPSGAGWMAPLTITLSYLREIRDALVFDPDPLKQQWTSVQP